jgi:hypothetical protein
MSEPKWKLLLGLLVAALSGTSPAAAQDYVHGVLARFMPQQIALNHCTVAGAERAQLTACMLTRGYKFCPDCNILGTIGGYPCGVLLGSTTSSPCWISRDAEEPDKAQPSPQPQPVEKKPCADPCTWDKAAVS